MKMNLLAVTKLTEKPDPVTLLTIRYCDLLRTFLSAEGYTPESRLIAIKAAAYLAATAISRTTDGHLLFKEALQDAIATIKGVEHENPDRQSNPPHGQLRRPVEGLRQKPRTRRIVRPKSHG